MTTSEKMKAYNQGAKDYKYMFVREGQVWFSLVGVRNDEELFHPVDEEQYNFFSTFDDALEAIEKYFIFGIDLEEVHEISKNVYVFGNEEGER